MILLINNMLVSLKIGSVSSAFRECIDCIQSNDHSKRIKKKTVCWKKSHNLAFRQFHHHLSSICIDCSHNWDYNIRMMHFASLTGPVEWHSEVLFHGFPPIFLTRVWRLHSVMKPTTFQNVFSTSKITRRSKSYLNKQPPLWWHAIDWCLFFVFVHSFVDVWEEKNCP